MFTLYGDLPFWLQSWLGKSFLQVGMLSVHNSDEDHSIYSLHGHVYTVCIGIDIQEFTIFLMSHQLQYKSCLQALFRNKELHVAQAGVNQVESAGLFINAAAGLPCHRAKIFSQKS
jgi:hypothetical protein